jgi:hypothetical protein
MKNSGNLTISTGGMLFEAALSGRVAFASPYPKSQPDI